MKLTIKQKKWQQLIEQWSHSGLSQAAFCRERGIGLKRFYAWKSLLAAKEALPVSEAGFVQMRVERIDVVDPPLVLRVGKVEILYQAGIGAATLAGLLDVLEARL